MVEPKTVSSPNRFWVVRKPGSQGTVVKAFDTPGDTSVVIPDTCIAYAIANRSGLENQIANMDQSVLTEEEVEILGVDQ